MLVEILRSWVWQRQTSTVGAWRCQTQHLIRPSSTGDFQENNHPEIAVLLEEHG